MSHPRYALTIVLILLLQIVVPARQAAIALDKNDPELRAILAEIEADAESAREKAKLPSLSIVIVHDQDVLLATGLGYADLENEIPADPQTVYRVGSVTKVFTALMLMQLRDAGKLQLDDPIEKYLPEFTIKSQFPDARPATFRQVAAHYSGLQREAPMTHEYQGLAEEYPSVEEELKSLKNVEMVLPALTIYNYSNLGYDILGLALSRVAQQPYDLYVVGHILKPLGMNDSGFALSEQMKSHFAVGYKSARPDGTYERSSYPKCGLAAGMLYSTADDLAKYLSLFFREGPAGGKQVLGSSSLREMLMPVAVSPDWNYGSTIGFSVNPFPEGTYQIQQIHYKTGGLPGFSSVVIINYQRKLGMALLTNTETDEETDDPFSIGYPLLKKLTPVLAKSLERTEDKMRKEMLPRWQTYTGRYVITDTNVVRILTFSEYDVSIKNQKLVVNVPELLPGSRVYMKEVPLAPYGENVFRVGGSSFGGDLMTFESNKDGSMILKWRDYIFKRQP